MFASLSHLVESVVLFAFLFGLLFALACYIRGR